MHLLFNFVNSAKDILDEFYEISLELNDILILLIKESATRWNYLRRVVKQLLKVINVCMTLVYKEYRNLELKKESRLKKLTN